MESDKRSESDLHGQNLNSWQANDLHNRHSESRQTIENDPQSSDSWRATKSDKLAKSGFDQQEPRKRASLEDKINLRNECLKKITDYLNTAYSDRKPIKDFYAELKFMPDCIGEIINEINKNN